MNYYFLPIFWWKIIFCCRVIMGHILLVLIIEIAISNVVIWLFTIGFRKTHKKIFNWVILWLWIIFLSKTKNAVENEAENKHGPRYHQLQMKSFACICGKYYRKYTMDLVPHIILCGCLSIANPLSFKYNFSDSVFFRLLNVYWNPKSTNDSHTMRLFFAFLVRFRNISCK